MLKKVGISLTLSLILANSMFAVSNDELLKKIESLEEKIKNLEEISSNEAEEIEDISSILDRVETKTLSDKIKFSPELRVRMDDFKYKMSNIVTDIEQNGESEVDRDKGGFDKNWKAHYFARLRLNMETDITDDTKFTGRISIARSSQNDERICILSRGISAASSNAFTSFDIDKAYFDYTFNKTGAIPFIFSAGILPTTGGLSSNLIEGTPRKSVFPSLIFDMASYGAIMTANLSKLLQDTWIRGVFGKSYTLDADQYYYQCNRETIQNADILGAFIETKIAPLGDNTIYIGVNKLGDLKATPYLGSSSAAVKLDHAQPMGDITNYAAGAEFRKIANTGLDLFVHGAMSNPNPNGNTINYTSVNNAGKTDALDTKTAFTNASYARGTMINDDGHAFYAGFRYTMPILNKAQFGAEYNKGSKYWFSGTQGSEDVFNKLAIRGDAMEFYYNQPWNRYITSRLGYLKIQEDYTGSGWHFGEPAKKEATQENIYFMINAYF